MSKDNKPYILHILGTGTSTGVPCPTCQCRVCTDGRPENQRMRTAAYIELKNKGILIDAGPDLRTQVLKHNIQTIDAVIITHDHADHTHGIDDVRPFCFGPPTKTIPVYTYEGAANDLRDKFKYIFQRNVVFKDRPILGGGIPMLDLHTVELETVVDINGEKFEFFLCPHGHTKTLGIIHEKMAYIVDCQIIPPKMVEYLKERELDLLILDCLQKSPHQTHLHLDKAIEYAEKINAKQTGLIHFNHDFEHFETLESLKSKYDNRIIPLIDGQKLSYNSLQ